MSKAEIHVEKMPTMRCPACAEEYDDFDGVGVMYCAPPNGCGFCRHVARIGKKRDGRTVMVCEYCGHVKGGEQP